MTKEEYIDSLTPDEMRSVIRQFWDWRNNNGCPMTEDGNDNFDCKKDFPQGWDEECDDDYFDQTGCWVRYYVWQYRMACNEKGLKTMKNNMLTDFEKLVKDMRAAQRTYFRTRNDTILKAAKELEREVDRRIAEKEKDDRQLKFFEEDDNGKA